MKYDKPDPAPAVKPHLRVGLKWKHDLVFDAGPAGMAPHTLDGDTKVAPSPPQMLLEALAGCVAIDVILILKKMQMPAASLACDITAERADGVPRRLIKAHLHFTITGDGIDEERAMRAIELSVTKYCTVRDSLDPEMPVTWSLDLTASARGSRAVALEAEPG